MGWLTSALVTAMTILSLGVMCQGRYFSRSLPSWANGDIGGNPFRDDPAFYPHVYPTRGQQPPRTKRMVFDSFCEGIFSRDVMDKLEDVCDSCYNLYRKTYIASECRSKCFNNKIFDSCLKDLRMHEKAAEYTSMVHFLGK